MLTDFPVPTRGYAWGSRLTNYHNRLLKMRMSELASSSTGFMGAGASFRPVARTTPCGRTTVVKTTAKYEQGNKRRSPPQPSREGGDNESRLPKVCGGFGGPPSPSWRPHARCSHLRSFFPRPPHGPMTLIFHIHRLCNPAHVFITSSTIVSCYLTSSFTGLHAPPPPPPPP